MDNLAKKHDTLRFWYQFKLQQRTVLLVLACSLPYAIETGIYELGA